MMAAKLLDENFTVGLKDLVWRYLSFGGYEKPLDEFRRENKASSFADVPVKKLAKYAAIDALATKRLWSRVLLPGLRGEGLERLFLRTLARVRMIFTSFEIIGLKVDRERARAISKRCVTVRAKLEKRMYKLAGREFKMSYQQLGKIIYTEMGVKVISTTPTGQPATDGDTMKALMKKRIPKKARAFIQALLDIKYIDKQLSTYINKIEKVVWEDGRVHTRFNLTGTVTGRPTSSDPNIANIPKDGLIRSLYIPDDGKVFLECDMSAAELRVLAQYSQEPTMLKAFRDGDDLHEETARAIYGLPKDFKPDKLQRDRGKRVNFGSVYGIGAKELANKFEIAVKEAEQFLERFFQRYAKVTKWLENNAKFGKRNGYVISFFKRKRRIPTLKSDSFKDQARAVRQANNAVIQSCASELCYVAMVRAYFAMQAKKMKARMVHSVYDSMLIELPKSEIPLAKRILKKSFVTPVDGVPDFLMDVEFTVTDRWGKGYPSKLLEVLNQVPWEDRSVE